MSYPPEIDHRDEGEVSARLVRADTPPDIVYSQSGNRVRLLATGEGTGGTDDIARTWGDISAHAVRRGRPRPQNDNWIAACCLAYDLPLATLNIKDFTDFAEHEGLTLLTP